MITVKGATARWCLCRHRGPAFKDRIRVKCEDSGIDQASGVLMLKVMLTQDSHWLYTIGSRSAHDRLTIGSLWAHYGLTIGSLLAH